MKLSSRTIITALLGLVLVLGVIFTTSLRSGAQEPPANNNVEVRQQIDAALDSYVAGETDVTHCKQEVSQLIDLLVQP